MLNSRLRSRLRNSQWRNWGAGGGKELATRHSRLQDGTEARWEGSQQAKAMQVSELRPVPRGARR